MEEPRSTGLLAAFRFLQGRKQALRSLLM